ncbi:hypothetical protein GWK47_000119 [Chionoecetes opilio]|uniref:Uncharacterized protein n=1 Tax=Chionoecetes opilio TaxID=41210 RepID=A0A8J4Y6F3_CHIOP|nr:hypothetical protein GWK47_000119 [Chionoecetes opilio]
MSACREIALVWDEVGEEDIVELLASHDEELSNEDLMAIEQVRALEEETAEEDDPEPQLHLTRKILADVISKFESGIHDIRPELHRWTWYSNAGGKAKEIDHILISTRWRILQNCRVYRSAEFFATDHRLVVATLKLYVKSRRISRGNHTVFNLEKLKDLTCAHEHAVAVSNRFDVLGALEDLVELWDTFKCETLKAVKECIGERPRSRRGFVSTETLHSVPRPAQGSVTPD